MNWGPVTRCPFGSGLQENSLIINFVIFSLCQHREIIAATKTGQTLFVTHYEVQLRRDDNGLFKINIRLIWQGYLIVAVKITVMIYTLINFYNESECIIWLKIEVFFIINSAFYATWDGPGKLPVIAHQILIRLVWKSQIVKFFAACLYLWMLMRHKPEIICVIFGNLVWKTCGIVGDIIIL